jgi:integrase/recombinase XerC
LRALYRALRGLELASGDPTLDLELPPRGELAARPLTDDEVTLARISAQVLPRSATAAVRATAWALGEATAVSSEITAVRIADLDSATHRRRVRLPGTRRHDPRTGLLTEWGQQIVARRVEQLVTAGVGPETLLAYGGAAPAGTAKAQASVCNALRDTMHAAGLAAEPDVRPASLRHWAGRRAYDAGAPIHEVALLLGHRSLDEAATDIALDWRPTPSTTTQEDGR